MPNNLALSCEQAMSVFFCHRLKRILGDASSQYCPCGESRHHSVATKITNLNLFPAGSVSGGGGGMGLTGVSSGRGRGVHSLPGVSHLGNEPVGCLSSRNGTHGPDSIVERALSVSTCASSGGTKNPPRKIWPVLSMVRWTCCRLFPLRCSLMKHSVQNRSTQSSHNTEALKYSHSRQTKPLITRLR